MRELGGYYAAKKHGLAKAVLGVKRCCCAKGKVAVFDVHRLRKDLPKKRNDSS